MGAGYFKETGSWLSPQGELKGVELKYAPQSPGRNDIDAVSEVAALAKHAINREDIKLGGVL